MANWKSLALAVLFGAAGCGAFVESFIDEPSPLVAQSRLKPGTTAVNVIVKQGSAAQWAKSRGLRVLTETPQIQGALILADGDAPQLAESLKKDPNVAVAEPDLPFQVLEPLPAQTSSLAILGRFGEGDPLMSRQYSLDIMHVKEAWQFSRGEGVKVGVIDTGFDYDHPDLKNQLLTGFSARFGEGTLFTRHFGSGSHGTHVAGIIAAEANNGLGISGVAPGAKIVPIRLWDDPQFDNVRQAVDPLYTDYARSLVESRQSWVSSLIQSLIYAADHGVSVVNMSIGMNPPKYMTVPMMNKTVSSLMLLQGIQSYHAAVNYALKKGVTILVAMGNERRQGSPVNLLALHPGIVAVGATDDRDRVAVFSNQGPNIWVSAPGVDVLSTVPASIGNATYPYEKMSGTSMATPNAAGVTALAKATCPALSPAQMRVLLQHAVDDIGPAGFDPDFGHGRLNALKAVAIAKAIANKQR